MDETIALTVRPGYVAQLDVLRRLYGDARREVRAGDATDRDTRYLCWSKVAAHLEWSSMDDISKGFIAPDDVALWRRVRARMDALRRRPVRSLA